MFYPKRHKSGHAGEYFVAYTITKLFGWPCRLFGVDLGVDAEMEILDEHQQSTGDIIKIQVKTYSSFKNQEAQNVYVDPEHIFYWKHFCLPIVVCCVDLEEEKIFWRHITATEAFDSDGKSKRITFNLQEDELTVAAGSKLRELVCPQESKQLEELFQSMKTALAELPAPETGHLDHESIAHTGALCDALRKHFSRIDHIVTHFPWRINSVGLDELNRAKRRVQIVENNLAYDQNSLAEGL